MTSSGDHQGSGLPDAWFLGPKAEHGRVWGEFFRYIIEDYFHWRRNYFPHDPVVISRSKQREHEEFWDAMGEQLDAVLNELKAHFPFYSPRYIAHMLSEQSLPAVLGYLAGMLYNPNNVTDEAAPVTVRLELEVGRQIAAMIGYDEGRAWAHLTSGGTMANIEALWVARLAQFVPLMVQDFCRTSDLSFPATDDGKDIRELTPARLVALPPGTAVTMPRRLVRHLVRHQGDTPEYACDRVNESLQSSDFNPGRVGVHAVSAALGLQPRLFTSAAAHYSIPKSANVLGYGQKSVQLVGVTDDYRLDAAELGERLWDLGEDEYIAAVIGIVGTTEMGSVDPMHEITALRRRLEEERRRSFWIHADAAWGGYIASLFRGHGDDIDAVDPVGSYTAAIDAREPLRLPARVDGDAPIEEDLAWDDPEVYRAFLALGEADSVTVDPHKMGYVPYPAGLVAFRSGLVTELITQRAQCIAEEPTGVSALEEPEPIDAVGPFIIEGSKPGAAATACWLAHTTIPLEARGHGQIMKATLLSAQRLTRYLELHADHLYWVFEEELRQRSGEKGEPFEPCRSPFAFRTLFKPDTNLVCFLAVPRIEEGGRLVAATGELGALNRLNEAVYEQLTIPHTRRGIDFPYAQPYFVSRTRLGFPEYSPETVAKLLEELGISSTAFEAAGLFVLRATVMNPFYHLARSTDRARPGREPMDYLLDFVRHLHAVTRQVRMVEG